MDNIVEKFDTTLNTILQDYIKKPTIIRGVVHLLLMLYLARIAPVPPKAILKLFDNVYFKLFVFSLVLWTAQFSPSTSILIALAFMVTINYTTTGKVWEMMENMPTNDTTTATVTPTQSIEAVKVLASSAISPLATPASVIIPIANMAVVSTSTSSGVAAVQALAQQSMIAHPGTKDNVILAASTAINSMMPTTMATTMPTTMATTMPTTMPTMMPTTMPTMMSTTMPTTMPTQMPVVTPIQAIQALSAAAASPSSVPSDVVTPVATVAMSAMTTPEGINAIKSLAKQATMSDVVSQDTVSMVAKVAVESLAPSTQTGGCYPLRNYDMSKVSGQEDGRFTFEDYQTFKSTPQ